MCRLLGIIARKQTDANYWFFQADTPFENFSKKPKNKEEIIAEGPHDDGWGIGWLVNDKWKIFKQGEEQKPYNFDKIKKIKSPIILIHLRKASPGFAKTARNAHPFKHDNWIFEHNGGVNKEKVKECLNSDFIKELYNGTDTKAYFLLIMQFFEETGEIVSAIKKAIEIIKKDNKYTGLNFIMSDGKKLYVFRDVNPIKKREDYYTLYYLVSNNEVVISSNPLTDYSWIPLNLGDLVIVDENLKIDKIKI